jgi:hypothetical protein
MNPRICLYYAYLLINFQFINCQNQNIEDIEVLVKFLNNSDTNSTIGILSMANFLSVKNILPEKVTPVLVEHEDDLLKMVLNDSIIAALVTGIYVYFIYFCSIFLIKGLPHDQNIIRSLNIFSSTVVSLHSIFMAPDKSGEIPFGISSDSNLSTKHLSEVINAAIMKMQLERVDKKLAEKNYPKEIISANTCKNDQLSQFYLPNKKDAQGLLKQILETKKLKILSSGPSNWGDNDGNYLVSPPIGFYPDYLDAILEQFKNFSGPDKEKYGAIVIERIYSISMVYKQNILSLSLQQQQLIY